MSECQENGVLVEELKADVESLKIVYTIYIQKKNPDFSSENGKRFMDMLELILKK